MSKSKYLDKVNEGSERIKLKLATPRYNSSNDTFAHTDGAFQAACRLAKVKPTRRQASKWRNKQGAAWKAAKA